MIKSFCIILTASSLLFACHKSTSDISRQVTDSSFSGLLQKKVTDSISGKRFHIENEYFYDSDGRLARVETRSEIDSQGNLITGFHNSIVYRDNLGRIIRIADDQSDRFQMIEYDGNSNKLNKIIHSRNYHEYFYGSNNRVNRMNHYQRDSTTINGFRRYAYSTYQYDHAGNEIRIDYFYDYYGNGNFVLDTKAEYFYDDKINPESIIYEDALSGYFILSASPNNVSKVYVEWTSQWMPQDTLRNIYTYDSLNRPVRLVSDGSIETKYFYY